MRLLTYAGESDVDKANQYAVSTVLFGPGFMQETQMLLDAKKYIVQNANGTFIDEAGKMQKLFVANGGDFGKPMVHADYKNNVAYRDFYWTVTSTNLLPDNPSIQERAVYNEREKQRLKSELKSFARSAGPLVIGVGIQAGRGAVGPLLSSKSGAAPVAQAVPENIGIPSAVPGAAKSIEEVSTATNAGLNGKYAVKPPANYSVSYAIDEATSARIQALPNGLRPEPSTYFSQGAIETHLANFEGGGSYLVTKDALDRYGRDLLGRPDNTQFIMTKTEMDQMLSRSNGDVSVIETQLGIPSGAWQGKDLVRIDILAPRELGLRMPSGNESGANPLWIPVGKLPTGQLEAVVNSIPKGKYVESELWH